MFELGVAAGIEKVAAAAVVGAEDTTSGQLEPGPEAFDVRRDRVPQRRRWPAERRQVKTAENVSQTIDSSDVGSKAQTTGESEAQTSAGQVTGNVYRGHRGHLDSHGRPNSKLPMWLRLNKDLPGGRR